MDRVYVMQLVRSFQVGGISRREFLARASVALGSVAAANILLVACAQSPAETPPPVVVEEPEATAPTASEPETEEALITETVEYPDADGETLMGYLARPEGADPLPAIVVIQEWWGVDDHIKDVARRFAREEFVALAPDLYHGVVVSEPDEARKLVMELDMIEAVCEIQQAIDFLQAQDFVAGPKVGIVGFCMGGRLVLQTARVEDDLGAAVAYYGSALTPEEATEVKAPILGLYGSEDGGIPVDSVHAMETAFKDVGIENEIRIYEGAGHAFFNDTRSSYRCLNGPWPVFRPGFLGLALRFLRAKGVAWRLPARSSSAIRC